MIDYIKLRIDDISAMFRRILKKLRNHPDFIKSTPRTNAVETYHHKKFGRKLSIDFRKYYENGKQVECKEIYIILSPHYHFNKYRHNGNDFSSQNCITALREIFIILNLTNEEIKHLIVCGLEFGVNVIPLFFTGSFISGFFYYKREVFFLPKTIQLPFFRTTKKKENEYIGNKVYWKGKQCHEALNATEVDFNTFRYEVFSNQSKKIKKYGIFNATDLLNPKIYDELANEIIKNWNYLLVINMNLQTDEPFLQYAKEINFWDNLLHSSNRNEFRKEKKEYYRLLKPQNNLHHQMKLLITDKLNKLITIL